LHSGCLCIFGLSKQYCRIMCRKKLLLSSWKSSVESRSLYFWANSKNCCSVAQLHGKWVYSAPRPNLLVIGRGFSIEIRLVVLGMLMGMLVRAAAFSLAKLKSMRIHFTESTTITCRTTSSKVAKLVTRVSDLLDRK